MPPVIYKRLLSKLDACLIDLTDVKLAFEDINKKLVDVVSVADVDALECVNDSLVDILRLMLSQDFEPEYLSRY